MKTKTITLDKEAYLYLYRLLEEHVSDLESDADVSSYSEEELSDRPWRADSADKAIARLPLARKLFDAVLFGEV